MNRVRYFRGGVLLRGRENPRNFGGVWLKERLGITIQESTFNQGANEPGITLIAKASPQKGTNLGNTVVVDERNRVTVGIPFNRKGRIGKDRLCGFEKFGSLNGYVFAIFKVPSLRLQGKQDASWAPAELVSKWVVGAFGCRKTSAEGNERLDFSSFGFNLLDDLQSIKVIDP